MEILINILIVISNTSLDMVCVQALEADSPKQIKESKLTSFKARQLSDTTKQGVKDSRFDSDGRGVLWRIEGSEGRITQQQQHTKTNTTEGHHSSTSTALLFRINKILDSSHDAKPCRSHKCLDQVSPQSPETIGVSAVMLCLRFHASPASTE